MDNFTGTENNSDSEADIVSSGENMSDVFPTCSDGFYNAPADGLCKPHCGTWLLYPPALEAAMITLIIVAMVIGTLGGSVVLLISCSDYKRA